MIKLIDATGEYTLNNAYIWAFGAIYIAVLLAFYLLRSIGLFVLANRQGVKNSYLAFIPFVWIYVMCKLIGNVRFFFDSFSKLAIWITIVFVVSNVINWTVMIIDYFPLIGYFLQGGEIQIVETVEGLYLNAPNLNNPFDVEWVKVFSTVLTWIGGVLDLVVIVITVMGYIALFRKYWPQQYILASILSIFGFFSIFAFCIRKKDPIDYAEYLRQRNYYNATMYGYGQNPYGRNDLNNGNNNQSEHKDEPFSDFENNSDPFEEFDDKNNKK